MDSDAAALTHPPCGSQRVRYDAGTSVDNVVGGGDVSDEKASGKLM